MNNLFIIFLLTTNLYATDIQKSEQQHFIFPKWKEFHPLNKTLLHSHDHAAMVDIYTNDIATQPYIEQASQFPQGSIVLKPLYKKNDRNGYLARLVVMVKMHKGYDTEHNDWWYGVYDQAGTTVWFEGKIKSCIQCHEIAKKTDYLFSKKVMEEIDFEE
ncbi:cytochrome P460 family protein [Sulfurimonas sp. SWIR-19]|uniref:cytochrome P460 family protein n=1 Tax=Sulfurimonas sp. SWIR-19 TaxID=2878390 RepID=UPI001CF4B071|nr:cytochrome P460 family protein [Sulfurimonas sp. SWIR-19]UCN01397.1 cytochrome P460 family protein [Sulfurimonas sp. SWIR-19]